MNAFVIVVHVLAMLTGIVLVEDVDLLGRCMMKVRTGQKNEVLERENLATFCVCYFNKLEPLSIQIILFYLK